MSNLATPSPESVILEAVTSTLAAWARGQGGKAQQAEDPQHSIDQIVRDTSNGLTVSVFWGSDNVSGESRMESEALMEGVVNVIMSRPITAEIDKAKAIRRTLDLCHDLRKAVTGISRDDVQWLQMSPRYAGKSPITVAEGKLLNGYLLRFNVLYLRDDPGE